MKVVLSSNVPHYHYAAEALDGAGLLQRYITGIVPFDRRAERLLPRYWADKLAGRRLPEIDRERVTSLVVPELVQKATALTHVLTLERSNWVQNELFDRLAERRVGACDVFHHVSTIGLRSARRARRDGAVVVCDERAEFPDYQRSVLTREYELLGIPYSAPGLLWDERLKAEYETSDYLIVASGYARDTFVEAGYAADRVFVVPYGFEPSLFGDVRGGAGDTFRVLFCGRVTPRKGVHHLVQAFEDLEPADGELVLVGAVDPALRGHAARWARNPRIHFVGEVAKIRLPEWYGRASVLVLPSLADAQPLVCFEAMACGLPVIVTTATGSREIVRDGTDGFVVPPGDAAALRDRLHRLHDDPELAARMGASARTRIREFTWKEYERRLLDVYARLGAPRGGAAAAAVGAGA